MKKIICLILLFPAVGLFAQPTAKVMSTNVSSNGGRNGTASVIAIGGTPPYAYLWSTSRTTSKIDSLSAGVYTVTITDQTGNGPTDTAIIEQPILELEYTGWSFNTAFNLPAIRFNINSFTGNGPFGTLEAFNSLGAGFGISYGKINISSKTPLTPETPDADKTITEKNILGLYCGVLFSSANTNADSRLVFAPNLCIQLLNFQFGYGYELGTVDNSAHRSILTLSYSIALTKLSIAGSYLFSNPNHKWHRKHPTIDRNKKMDFKGFF